MVNEVENYANDKVYLRDASGNIKSRGNTRIQVRFTDGPHPDDLDSPYQGTNVVMWVKRYSGPWRQIVNSTNRQKVEQALKVIDVIGKDEGFWQ